MNWSMKWEKHIFYWGNGMSPQGITLPQDFWAIGSENIYFQPMYIDRTM